MRKKQLTAILPIILLLSACGATDNEPPQTSSPADTTLQTPEAEATVEPETEAAAFAASAPQLRSYQEVYTKTVAENTDSYTLFSLIYLDNDDIPELVIYDSYYLSYSVYTTKDDALFCMADALSTVELTYFERTGILCEFARWNGGGDEGGYGRSYYQASHDKTLTDSDAPILNDVYNAVYDAENMYTGEGVTEYFYQGEETDEASYKELENSLGITDGNEKACAENALEKEEMLALLSET